MKLLIFILFLIVLRFNSATLDSNNNNNIGDVSSSSGSYSNNATIRMPLYGRRHDHHHNETSSYYKKGNIPIKLSGTKTYIYTHIKLGGVSMPVIVDTGSELLVVPSVYCSNCNSPRPYYQPSQIAKFISCESEECYLNGDICIHGLCGSQLSYVQQTTINTVLVEDTFSFDNDLDNQVIATFGAIVSNSGKSIPHGIIGLGKMNDNCKKSPVELIFEKYNLPRMFSVYLNRNYEGELILGEIDLRHSKHLWFTPMLMVDGTHYGVTFSKVVMNDYYNRRQLYLNSQDFGEVILDTGATAVSLHEPAYYKIKRFLQNNCEKAGLCGSDNIFEGQCYDYPDEFYDSFPTIDISMPGGATMKILPRTYIPEMYQDGVKFRCFNIHLSTLRGKSIIGLAWLRENYIVFDLENQKVGFSKGLPVLNY